MSDLLRGRGALHPRAVGGALRQHRNYVADSGRRWPYAPRRASGPVPPERLHLCLRPRTNWRPVAGGRISQYEVALGRCECGWNDRRSGPQAYKLRDPCSPSLRSRGRADPLTASTTRILGPRNGRCGGDRGGAGPCAAPAGPRRGHELGSGSGGDATALDGVPGAEGGGAATTLARAVCGSRCSWRGARPESATAGAIRESRPRRGGGS